MNRRRMLLRAACTLAATACLPLARAQAMSGRPITLVVPFAPGGNIDIVGRGLAGPLGKALGTTVVVDNRAGAGGAVDTASVARAAADGTTLMVGTPGQLVTLPAMVKTAYTSASLRPVGIASRTSVIVVARRGDARLKSMADLVTQARSKPGVVSAGHAGPGTPNHLALLQLENLLKASFTVVPYRGSGPALIDLIGGQIDVHFDQVTSSMPHIKSGALQALAVLGPQPDPALPGVPTLAQLGLGDIDATTYAGVFAPASVPADLMTILAAAVQKAAHDNQFAVTLRELGSMAYPGTAEQFARIVEAEAAVAAQMVKEGRLKAE